MTNNLPLGVVDDESAHEAYNAAFYELGLPWHWDCDTYAALLRHSADPRTRVRHYIESRHPHLLRAYDADFLAAAIHERVQHYKPCSHRHFDWAQAAACQVGI